MRSEAEKRKPILNRQDAKEKQKDEALDVEDAKNAEDAKQKRKDEALNAAAAARAEQDRPIPESPFAGCPP